MTGGTADPGTPAPIVGWEPPPAGPTGREVPGAPGLVFSDTPSRFVAYIVDSLLITIVASIILVMLGFGRTTTTATSFQTTVSGAPLAVGTALLGLVYFVASWSGGRRATLGQRLFGIQVGNAFDGQPLSLEQALRRWLGLGSWLGVFAIIPARQNPAALVEFVWVIVLLVSTVTSPTKQGLHDRFANSAVVRPAGAGSGRAITCLLVLLLFAGLALLGAAFFFLSSDDIRRILSQIGNSI